MTAKVISLEEVRTAEPFEIPEGDYEGAWGGYEVTFLVPNKFDRGSKRYRCRTNQGIRTPRAPCVVTVKGGSITVKVKKPEANQ